jgi:hypothetical protein
MEVSTSNSSDKKATSSDTTSVLRTIFREVEPFVIFKREHVKRALKLLEQIRPRMSQKEFLEAAREVDAFSTLNYSKTKRISAADVEQHLRSKGVLAPVTTSSVRSIEEMELPIAQAINP